MAFVRYSIDGVVHTEETTLTASQLESVLTGAKSIVVQDVQFIDILKPTALSGLSARRNAKEAGGFTFNGNRFDSDERACARIIGAKLLADEVEKAAPGSFTVDWTAEDNSIISLNYAGVIGLFMALGQHIVQTHAAARVARAAIEAATQSEQIEAALATLA